MITRHAGEPGSVLGRSSFDVVVIGAGNAALCAAISAREQGCSVLMLERAARNDRGGNTRHTRNIRCVHNRSDEFSPGVYSFDELWKDLSSVGSGPTDERLAELTVASSEALPAWMSRHGISWQHALHGTLQLGRTNRFFLGGGKALLNRYFATAEALGVTIAYEALVNEVSVVDNRCLGVTVRTADGESRDVAASAVVCASGGYESNHEWLSRYWGDAAKNFYIRGPRHNDGRVLQALFDAGAKSAGEERGFHAVAVDARSPRFDGGIATRIDALPLGIVVNQRGERFYDEGQDLWPKRYALWGRLLAEQVGQIGYCLYDQKIHGTFVPPLYGAVRAGSVEELARHLGLDPKAVEATVAAYNAGVSDVAPFDPTRLDGRCTSGVTPPKSNWAQRLDAPPFYGIPLRPGITFTYRGFAVNESAQVLRQDGEPLANVFAAGEIMSGNILSTGYLAGFGMTIGTVWGRIAGEHAGRHARAVAAGRGAPTAHNL